MPAREAEVAAERALTRSRIRTAGESPSISDWTRLARAARLAAEIQKAKSKAPEKSEVNYWFGESIDAATKAYSLNPDCLDSWLQMMESRLVALKSERPGNQSDGSTKHVRSLFDGLYARTLDESRPKEAADHGRFRALAGLLLIDQQPQDKLPEFVEWISYCRPRLQNVWSLARSLVTMASGHARLGARNRPTMDEKIQLQQSSTQRGRLGKEGVGSACPPVWKRE